jgi:hypothetical protein
MKLRKIESEYESAAKKLDMFLCDLQSATKLIKQCKNSISNEHGATTDKISLIKKPHSELQIEFEETSRIQQLHEVCENAMIYESASASLAIIPRSQLLDKMANFNNIAPSLFSMSEKIQLEAGNQMVNLLLSRLKTWTKVNDVIDGNIKLEELSYDERITPSEITFITKNKLIS